MKSLLARADLLQMKRRVVKKHTHTHIYIGDPKRSVFNIGEMGLDDQNRDQN